MVENSGWYVLCLLGAPSCQVTKQKNEHTEHTFKIFSYLNSFLSWVIIFFYLSMFSWCPAKLYHCSVC